MKVKALETGYCSGVSYRAGETYDFPEEIVNSNPTGFEVLEIETPRATARQARSRQQTKIKNTAVQSPEETTNTPAKSKFEAGE